MTPSVLITGSGGLLGRFLAEELRRGPKIRLTLTRLGADRHLPDLRPGAAQRLILRVKPRWFTAGAAGLVG